MNDSSPSPRRCHFPDLYPHGCFAGCYCGRTVTTVHLPEIPDCSEIGIACIRPCTPDECACAEALFDDDVLEFDPEIPIIDVLRDLDDYAPESRS